MASHRLPVQLACRVLGVAKSGHYNWRGRSPSAPDLRHVWLADAIRQVHADSFGVYGATASTPLRRQVGSRSSAQQ